MTTKCYKNEDSDYICSDDVLFIENPEDIIDDIYIKDVWFQEPEIIYKEILNEWKLIHICTSKEDISKLK